MSQHREHFYMATATIHYVRGTDMKQMAMNLVMQLPKKQITASVLNSTRLALFDRLIQESGVSQEECRSIVFDAFSYLGFMTQADFHDIKESKEATDPTTH